MDENRGVFPEPRPMGHKVLRKVIAKRGYSRTGQSILMVATYVNGQLMFHQQRGSGSTQFMRYMFGEPYFAYVTALYYLHTPGAQSVAEVETEWKRRPDNRRQWGQVVYTDYSRCVSSTWCFGNDLWSVMTSIVQLYPCMSIDTSLETGARMPGLHLCLGFYFGQTSADRGVGDQRGRRRYQRGPIPDPHHILPPLHNRDHYEEVANQVLHSLGNAWEINDRRFVGGIPQTPGVNHFFVLYVCAGARLVVCDDLNCNDGHNRSLVQQGGFVVVEYELEWAPPPQALHPCGPFRPVTTAQAIQTGFLRPNPNLLAINPDLMAIENPVVFLGATESKYETHCWALSFEVVRSMGGQRRALLTAPEGGVVLAIENDTNGMAEIQGRHRYEQLYGSVITNENYTINYCCNPFAVPAQPAVVDRILGAGQYSDRWLAVDYSAPGIYHSNVAPVPARPAPFTYTPIVCVNHSVTVGSQLRPPMLPLSPLFHIAPINKRGNPVGPPVHQFMPTEHNPEWHWQRDGSEWHRLVRGNKYEKYTRAAQPQEVDQYSMGKCDYYVTDHIDGRTKYVGIDGWVYYKQNANKVGTFQYPVYQRPDATYNLYND